LRRLFGWGVNVEDSLAVMDLVNVKLRDRSVGYREKIVHAVNRWLEFKGKPKLALKFKRERKIPEVPLEKDLDALINALPLSCSCLCRLLKETAFRPGEALRLRVKDIDFERGIITLNKPEKGSNSRQVKISHQLQAQLKTLISRKNLGLEDRIWNGTVDGLSSRFRKWRKRIAEKLGNPRILKISWYSFRHWKATMEYHKTKDILYVKELLGHKNINNTLVYTHMVDWKEEDYIVKVAASLEEAVKLLEAGFEYVTDWENKKLFRKRK